MHALASDRSEPAVRSAQHAPFSLRWEGGLFAHHSLATVNRELCARLFERGHAIHFARSEPDTFDPGTVPLQARLARALSERAHLADSTHTAHTRDTAHRDTTHTRETTHASETTHARNATGDTDPTNICVRHHWPPDFTPVPDTRLVLIQPWEYGSLPRAWVEPLRAHVDEVWVPTTWVRDTYLRAGVERVHVVHNGVDTTRFHPSAAPHRFPHEADDTPTPSSPTHSSHRAAFRFLFVGGALPRKGVHILLEAWRRAFTRSDGVELVIKDFGAGTVYRGQSLRALVTEAAAQPGAARIVYSDDTLDDAQMPGLYTACDALVHPYLAEGFGLPIAEAMACARPVIVTGGGAALDFCNSGNAYLIPARPARMSEARVGDLETLEQPLVFEPDVDALAALLRQVASDPHTARATGRRARQSIRARFTWEHAADAAEARIHDLLPTRPIQSLARPSISPSLTSPALSPTPIEVTDAYSAGTRGLLASGATAPEAWNRLPSVSTAQDLAPDRSPPGPAPIPIRFGAAPFNYSGYARLARMLLPHLDAAGAHASLQPYATDRKFLEHLDPTALSTWHTLLSRDTSTGIHVAFHPPVGWDGYRFLRNARAQNPRACAHVAYTMFETDRLPPLWAAELGEMDEVWVPCRFNLETFARAGVPEHKLRLFQPGLDLSGFRPDVEPYPIAGTPCAFTFLSVFQWTRRKGWDVLIEAFTRAFTRADDVRLVIRAYPGERKSPPIRERVAQHLHALRIDPAHAPRIVVIDEFVSEADLPRLYAAADAYVLPTRGEGFGLPYLEAMAAGLPTIGTNWSGQLDFLDDDVGYLIDIDGLEPVDPEQTAENPYYAADHQWARPSVEHTIALMQQVVRDRGEARARGARARERVFADWSAGHGAQRFVALARDLHERTARSPSAGATAPDVPPVMWHGPLLGISGYADEGRDMVFALDELGTRLRVAPEQWGGPAALLPREVEVLSRVSSTVLFEPPIAVEHGFGDTALPSKAALASVCRTMFETDRAPAAWVAPLNRMDEVWVPSAFGVEAFARSGVERSKLHVVHGTIDARRYEKLPPPLAVEGARGFNFLSVFDWSIRKGWDVLLRAYAEAFRARDDVALILKVHSTLGLTPEDMRARIRAFAQAELGRDPGSLAPILLLTARQSRDELVRLFVAADAYVMPTRGEGWGRPFVEAMACAKPVIGTRFGGSLEILDDDTSHLIDAREVDVPEGAVREQPLFAGHRWGEPSPQHLAELMRRVVRDRKHARKLGRRAREVVLARFDRSVVARTIQRRLMALGAAARSAR